METLKKHMEIYKINRQISHLRAELVPSVRDNAVTAGGYIMQGQDSFPRETEKEAIIRQSINTLLEHKASIRNK